MLSALRRTGGDDGRELVVGERHHRQPVAVGLLFAFANPFIGEFVKRLVVVAAV